MKSSDELKKIVKEKYSEIAKASVSCGCSCCGSPQVTDISDFSEDYKNKDGYYEDADLGLGCGIPTDFADIKKVILCLTSAQVQVMTALLLFL